MPSTLAELAREAQQSTLILQENETVLISQLYKNTEKMLGKAYASAFNLPGDTCANITIHEDSEHPEQINIKLSAGDIIQTGDLLHHYQLTESNLTENQLESDFSMHREPFSREQALKLLSEVIELGNKKLHPEKKKLNSSH
ncbi:MAG TPA: hypothetical protein VMR81_00995 [Patescibacteria group bacterium]|nr:hypothetical protein [Patescibacteria group bacterium]